MVFEAVVYHIDNCLIFRLLKDYPSVEINLYEKTYYDQQGFKILRQEMFEITTTKVYLPGAQDISRSLPRSFCIKFESVDRKQLWLESYKKAYEAVNHCEPIIVKLNCFFETEFILERRII